MTILILFAFIAGFVTILSPCILPLLPIILAGGVVEDKKRPLGIVIGFVGSFTFFTLALSSIVKSTGLSADFLRSVAVILLLLFGLLLVVPQLKKAWELFSARFSPSGSGDKHGFGGGLLIGLSLGLVWTPCVGPILASVITLAASSTVTSSTALITLSYAIGTAIPLFLVMRGSGWFMSRFSWLKNNSGRIQQIFGLLMIGTSLLLFFQLDRRFQTFVLDQFPSYGSGLTKIEDNSKVQENLGMLESKGGKMTELKSYGVAPEITGGDDWINLPAGEGSEPLTLSELKGKVVLVDFWTYSCINCIRTLPYLKAWYAKYHDAGFEIVGVHTPEFEFEHDLDNVKNAVKDFEIKYPVVLDNDYKIWRAYDNHYWPAKYLIDKEGKIREIHFGEGGYDETEMAIQELLGEAVGNDFVDVPSYSIDTRSPETYVGYERMQNFVSKPQVVEDKEQQYTTPDTFENNGLGFRGVWRIESEQAVSSAGSSLLFHFDAKDVHLVMSPTVKGVSSKAEVYIDGVKSQTIDITEYKLYNIVHLEKEEKHYVEIRFPQGGVNAYAFTFG